MNLFELCLFCIEALKEKKGKSHVVESFNKMGVNTNLSNLILNCFDEKGNFIDGLDNVYKIKVELKSLKKEC